MPWLSCFCSVMIELAGLPRAPAMAPMCMSRACILAIADAGGYGVPVPGSNSFSQAEYFGIFSCEGQGLDRLPGSNQCIDRAKSTK